MDEQVCNRKDAARIVNDLQELNGSDFRYIDTEAATATTTVANSADITLDENNQDPVVEDPAEPVFGTLPSSAPPHLGEPKKNDRKKSFAGGTPHHINL